MKSNFVYATCQLGAEPALKAEVARLHPEWRFAFSRPGLVTWKSPEALSLAFELDAVFARTFGLSLGRAASAEEGAALLLEELPSEPFALHVFTRDPEATLDGDQENELVKGALTDRILTRPLKAGDLVANLIVAPGEPAFVGVHRHTTAHSPFPGGRPPLILPSEAPSRAWLKLEEGLIYSGFPLAAGQVAVEVGSAPGGASHALLSRGLTVVGVDPAEMDELVLGHPAFTHLRKKLGEVRREDLPEVVDWLLLDVNLAPAVALHQLMRLVSPLRSTLRGGIFTLKLNDWKMAEEIPSFLERIRAMGFMEVRATQLSTSRREICVAARMKVRAR